MPWHFKSMTWSGLQAVMELGLRDLPINVCHQHLSILSSTDDVQSQSRGPFVNHKTRAQCFLHLTIISIRAPWAPPPTAGHLGWSEMLQTQKLCFCWSQFLWRPFASINKQFVLETLALFLVNSICLFAGCFCGFYFCFSRSLFLG